MKKALIATVLIGTYLSFSVVTASPAVGATLDKTAPTVTAFSVPLTVNSTKVPIAAFKATDNIAVTGYLITEVATRPVLTAAGWQATAPASYAAATAGAKKLYAWAKDRAGNISAAVMAMTTIDTTAPKVSQFIIPSQVNTLNIPVTTLRATDNIAVTGYLITEVATTPALTGSGWQAVPPASYPTATTGTKTLYAWARDGAGNISLAKTATTVVATTRPGPDFNLAQTLSDGAQRTTLAFDGLGMMTGNLDAQSFFPPGKVADYTGFQYLRDNDPDNMGHNTSFLTRVANNVIYILNDSQFALLKTLAVNQLDQINLYGYRRFTLMEAFRLLLDGNIPASSTGLNLDAVKQASRELYLLDGQISFDRALLYAGILKSIDSTQKAYLEAMKGKGFNSWPDIAKDQIDTRMKGLPQGSAQAVMTYAGDLFSWYAGSVEADVYFCPERHGTYYGSFYMKDAPAVGHEGYSIDEQLTATAGAALSDSSKGYVTSDQAKLMSSLVDTQRSNLYEGTPNIVSVRTQIATLLRSLWTSSLTEDQVKAVNTDVLALSATYGELDGENNYHYATVFSEVYKSLSGAQMVKIEDLRKSILSGTYADGTPFDYSVATTPYLYSAVIADTLIKGYLDAADDLFFEPPSP